ncbi:C39 family peptidase [Nonomuraea sp. NPDC050663]|uniref:C39 family peptidase n=1 Tax=Nonomuraea sp. NPDC050663 TaxID=3364370 RepID=UPI0037A2C9D9
MRIVLTLAFLAPPTAVAVPARALYQAEQVGPAGPYERRGERAVAIWTGPERRVPFPASELVPSWTADTPPGTRIRVEVSVPGSGWYVLGRWSYDGPRTTVKGQADTHGRVRTDVFRSRRPFTSYRLRVALIKPYGSAVRPSLRTFGAVVSAPGGATAEGGGLAWGRELRVPRKSQLEHAGHGGGAWCSPTATAMVLHYWNRGPSAKELAWVPDGDADPRVDHAARHTYDEAYKGTGNWAFNAAYAGRFGLKAHVTRLTSLAGAEEYIARDIPVVASLAFTRKELGYASEGHLMVITGFTAEGDVIANDPGRRQVRQVYPRAAFERAWMRSSTGTTYIIHP